MRTFNWKFGLVLLIGVAVLAIVMQALHSFQGRRTSTSSLTLADKARDEGHADKELKYHRRYLEQKPETALVQARYGLALNKQARTIEEQRQALATLALPGERGGPRPLFLAPRQIVLLARCGSREVRDTAGEVPAFPEA